MNESPKQSPKTNKEIQIQIEKYKKKLADEILTDEETNDLNEKIKNLEKKEKTYY